MNEGAQASQNDKWLVAPSAVGQNVGITGPKASHWPECEGRGFDSTWSCDQSVKAVKLVVGGLRSNTV